MILVVLLDAGRGAEHAQFPIVKHRARLAAHDLETIRRAGRVAGRRHRAGHIDRRAGICLEEDRGERFAAHVRNRARRARADNGELAAEKAHHVEMMDEHFRDHQLRLVLHEWLARERGPLAARVGQKAGRDHRHAREEHVAKVAGDDPALQLSVPRPEAPVLVHHEPHFALGPARERLGFGERRRHRLLAQHVDATRGGCVDPARVRLTRRSDVEHVDRFPSEHRVGIGVSLWYRELLRTGRRLRAIGIANRDDAHAITQVAPAEEMKPTDHSRAGERDLQRTRSSPHRHRLSLRTRRALADCEPARALGRSVPGTSATTAPSRRRRRDAAAH